MLYRARQSGRQPERFVSAVAELEALEQLALTGETYQLAFTPGHLVLVFADRVTPSMVIDEGRFVRFADDERWWIPSGRIFLSPDESDDAAQELAFARAHFFIARRFRDPFGETATVEYDTHDLLTVRTADALGNSVTARHDYRLLSAELLSDPNGNRAVAAVFDVLGMVVGTALMKKEILGDSFDEFQTQLTGDHIDAFFADPRGPVAAALLGGATTRTIY